MAQSFAGRRTRVLARIMDSVSESHQETLSIMADVDALTDLMTSLMEVKQGKVVPFDLAFADI